MEDFKYHNLYSLDVRVCYYGYKEAYYPEHPNSRVNGYVGYHRLVMENMIGRYLTAEEEVHHKDKNPLNNRPCNLKLCANTAEHNKEHIGPPPKRICCGCGRSFTVVERIKERNGITSRYSRKQYCSKKCSKEAQKNQAKLKSNKRVSNRPTKEQLQKLVWEMPSEKIGSIYGVSGRAIGKWCKKYNIDKPPRGYWSKIK